MNRMGFGMAVNNRLFVEFSFGYLDDNFMLLGAVMHNCKKCNGIELAILGCNVRVILKKNEITK